MKQEEILTLTPLEHVRLRPGVYAGDTSNPNQLVMEVFANALDCYNAGYGNIITIKFSSTGEITCEDSGQGFAINELREDGTTTLEAAFSVMNTSGKFKDDGFYEGTSLGLNGMGSKICTFLSHYLTVKTYRKGKFESIDFVEGVFSTRTVGESSHADGTIVTFLPSEDFFTTIYPDEAFFKNFFNDITCLCPGLIIHFNGADIQHSGIEDLLVRKITGKTIEIINHRLIFNKKIGNQSLNFGLTFTSNSASIVTPYVNCGLTDTGPHITIIKTTITRVFNAWARKNGLLKEKEANLDGPSIQEGMILVCNITSPQVSYNAQVKTTVTKMDTSFISALLGKELELWLDNNFNDGKNIIEKALLARKAAEAARKAREAVKEKEQTKSEKVFKLPTKLTDCWGKDRSKCELLIAEGKSAAAGLVAARNSETQAVYGVRGKMLSVLKTTQEKILANQEINNIIQALGLEYDKNIGRLIYNENKLRYGKIIACADADADGAMIENLLFNILWYLCPELIVYGHVYSSIPPLFRVTTKKNEYIYLKGQKELDEYKIANPNSVAAISRMKGLGECDADELAYCLLDEETRNIVQLEVVDYGKTDKIFEDLYGKDVEPRVVFLAKHSEEGRADYE